MLSLYSACTAYHCIKACYICPFCIFEGAAHKRDGLELNLECLRCRCAKGYFADAPTLRAQVRARKRFQKTTVCREKKCLQACYRRSRCEKIIKLLNGNLEQISMNMWKEPLCQQEAGAPNPAEQIRFSKVSLQKGRASAKLWMLPSVSERFLYWTNLCHQNSKCQLPRKLGKNRDKPSHAY